MKKTGVLLVLLLVFSLVPLAFAAVGDACDAPADCDAGEVCTDSVCADEDSTAADDTTATTTTTSQQDPNKIEKGFTCLEDKAGDCSDLTNQEIAYTILATPDNVFDDCVAELEGRMENDNWGNVRDTALAILALNHAGKDTENSELWLLNQSQTPTDLIWYLEQDSPQAVECTISYDTNTYPISIGETKKLDSDAGPCLNRAQSSFWLQIDSECYEKEFNIECDQDFIATMIYKNRNSPTIYPIDGTQSAPAFGSIKLGVNSKCFGESSCNYEATAWASLALMTKGYNIESYIPYIVAMSESNKQYLPDSFSYMLTGYEDYASQLIADHNLGNYWEATGSAYNRFYDTALALIALSSSSGEQITKSKDWLLFSQSTANGCWSNSVRDTAMVLWALTNRPGKSPGNGGGNNDVERCSDAGFYCIPSNDCPSDEDVSNNFFCGISGKSCCKTENLESCTAYGGEKCDSDERCAGNTRKATDAPNGDCCTGTCSEIDDTTECENEGNYCKGTCSSSQEEVNYACTSGELCCAPKPTPEPKEGGSLWWVWILIILIIIVAAAIIWVKREEAKLLWFRIRSKFGKDKGKGGKPSGPGGPGGPRPGMPPRPGFPPVRRMPQRRMPARGPAPRGRPPARGPAKRSYDRRDPHMSDTFKKLREMSS